MSEEEKIEFKNGKLTVKVNYRILYSDSPTDDVICEAKVQEISPSKKYIKLNGRWYHCKKIKVLEVLGVG